MTDKRMSLRSGRRAAARTATTEGAGAGGRLFGRRMTWRPWGESLFIVLLASIYHPLGEAVVLVAGGLLLAAIAIADAAVERIRSGGRSRR